MLNGAKPLSNNNNSWAEEGQEKPKNELVKLERSPTKTTLRRTEPYKMLKRTTKPLIIRILIEEGLAKSSKKNSTRRTQTSATFVKHVAEMLTKTKPQEELGTRRCMNPCPHPHTPRKHSELKEPYEMLNKTKTLTTITIKIEGQRKSSKMNQSN